MLGGLSVRTLLFYPIYNIFMFLCFSPSCMKTSANYDFNTGNVTSQLNRTKMELVSSILDTILDENNYDSKIRPGHNSDKPLLVTINVHMRTMGPILEEKMVYYIDIYFRQLWMDERLNFNGSGMDKEIKVSALILDKIWKPDTFFLNGRRSLLHTITNPNKLLRVFPNGRILYSMRLTVKASCYMDLQKYPMDNQSCPLIIGSYAYSPRDVEYVWDRVNSFTLDNITLAQFQFMTSTVSQKTVMFAKEKRGVLVVHFMITRMIGFYLLQIYVPCYLIVAISWVSFWINREATPARVTLGITTLLTTTTIGMTGREGIPKVPYSTALDIFLLMCFFFVFAALLEYAGVNYFTKRGKIENNYNGSEDDDNNLSNSNHSSIRDDAPATDSMRYNNGCSRHYAFRSEHKKRCPLLFLQCLRGNARRIVIHPDREHSGGNSVSQIDKASRIGFPLMFFITNLVYWTVLMNKV